MSSPTYRQRRFFHCLSRFFKKRFLPIIGKIAPLACRALRVKFVKAGQDVCEIVVVALLNLLRGTNEKPGDANNPRDPDKDAKALEKAFDNAPGYLHELYVVECALAEYEHNQDLNALKNNILGAGLAGMKEKAQQTMLEKAESVMGAILDDVVGGPLDDVDNKNIADARDMYADVVDQKYAWVTPVVLSAVIVVLFSAVLLCLMQVRGEVDDLPFYDVILIMIGALVACFKDVYNFFFGSSAGSKEKTKAIIANKSGGV